MTLDFRKLLYFVVLMTALVTRHGSAQALAPWVWRNPLPQGDLLTTIEYANAQFIAGGTQGKLLFSTNGISWRIAYSGFPGDIAGLALHNGIYIAAGQGRIGDFRSGYLLRSTNGVKWQKVLENLPPMLKVSSVAETFFVTSLTGSLLSSTNGFDWTSEIVASEVDVNPLTAPILGADGAYSISYAGLVFKRGANGWNFITRVRENVGFRGMAYANGLYIAVGDGGENTSNIFISSDALSWFERPSGATASLYTVKFLRNIWVATGQLGTLLTSTDGSSWKLRSTRTLEPIPDIAFGNGTFVALGPVLISPDGESWVTASDPVTSEPLRAVAIFGNSFIAVGGGNHGVILTSKNGVSWNQQSLTTPPLYAITRQSNRSLVVGAQGTILTSTNGISWETEKSGTTNDLRAVISVSNTSLAAGSRGAILRSQDYHLWTAQKSPIPDAEFVGGVFGYGRYAFVGYSRDGSSTGLCIVSSDGKTWVPSLLQKGYPLSGIAYGNGRFIAVGNYRIYSSFNGTNWSQVDFSSQISSDKSLLATAVVFASGRFYISGYGMVLYSSDGLLWKQEIPTTRVLFSIAEGLGSVIAVGSGGAILQRPAIFSLAARFTVSQAVTLSFTGDSAQSRLESTTNLNSGVWEPVTSAISDGNELLLTPDPLNFPRRFFRAVANPLSN